ncbi:MAG: hypothetical protein RBR67_19375 [Desulfobacterium sp.]|jgi:hypothetical protein|nr:hypothetical protein [Desulfobacterium sp.]
MGILVYLGLFIFVAGGIGTLIVAFKTSVWWGLGCLFIAPVSLLFLFMNWSLAKKPFFLQLAGAGIMLLGSYT